MGALSRLFRPLDYVRIKHTAKTKYDFHIPFYLASAFTLILLILPVSPKISGDGGLIDVFTGLLQMLTGFYIASLAAISTFNKEGMDNTMPGDPPTLASSYRGKIKTDLLTRRRFLCLMFGYLSLVSIFLYFTGAGALLIAPSAKAVCSAGVYFLVKWFFVLTYLFIASNLIITTMLGLFYMVDRIHRHDPELIDGNKKTESAAPADHP